MGKGAEGGFWSDRHILFLDLGAHPPVCEKIFPPAAHLYLCVFLHACCTSQNHFTMGINSLTLQRRKLQPREGK